MSKQRVCQGIGIWVHATVLSLVFCATSLVAQESKFAVDIVHLKDHKQVRGCILDTGRDVISVALSREWLRSSDRGRLEKLDAANQLQSKGARENLLKRLKDLDTTNVHPAFQFSVLKEIERVEKLADTPESIPPQFYVVPIKGLLVSRISSPTNAGRKVAQWGWFERLDGLESKTTKQLTKELTDKGLDPTSAAPDLSDRFPIVADTDDQWSARILIKKYLLVEPIQFQGTGKSMFQVGPNAPKADLSALMGELMQSQSSALLNELLSGKSSSINARSEKHIWIQAAILQAEKLEKNYFQATHVPMDSSGQSANVQSVLMIRLNGRWQQVWQTDSQFSIRDLKPDDLERVKKDPQVDTITSQLKSLGLPTEGLDKALQFGAATMKAQQKVDDDFNRFMAPFQASFERPAIVLKDATQ
jgi:hypothetical protein